MLQCRVFMLVPCRVPFQWRGGSADVCHHLLWSSLQADPTPSPYSPESQTLRKRLSSWKHTKMEDHYCCTDSLISFIYDRLPSLSAEVLPGAGDGAHGVGVAGALSHTAHLTTVAVHLPHTHWPVLKTWTRNKDVIFGLCGLHLSECTVIHCLLSFDSLCAAVLQRCLLTFAQLAKRNPFLNTSSERTVSVDGKQI